VPLFVNKLKLPPAFTVILLLTAPVFHTLPVKEDDVSTTLSPSQKVVALLAEIVGVAGRGLTVTEEEAETRLWQVPFDTLTE
jgi:hypothetical protein